jgi:putative oxidoreductase
MDSNRWNDAGLLWLRVSTSLLLYWTNGWPKIIHYASELQTIDDPIGLGRSVTLWLALFSEVACPLGVALGCLTRLACIPIMILLLVTMTLVHGDWSFEQGQFGWLYLIVYSGILLTGPGRYAIDTLIARVPNESSICSSIPVGGR